MKISEIIKWLVDKLVEDGDKEITDFFVTSTSAHGQPKETIELRYEEE